MQGERRHLYNVDQLTRLDERKLIRLNAVAALF
jgi:hypothetical protein